MSKKTIDQRINELEKKMGYDQNHTVPGTSIIRIINTNKDGSCDIMWSLSVGLFQDKKYIFTGKTIEDCIKNAEKQLL